MTLAFTQRSRKRHTATGAVIREWKSTDGRYIVSEINSPGYGVWYRAIRQLVCGQTLASPARHRTLQAAKQACQRYLEA